MLGSNSVDTKGSSKRATGYYLTSLLLNLVNPVNLVRVNGSSQYNVALCF